MIPSTLHPAQLQLPLYGTGRRARSAQTAQKKNDTNMLHSSFPVFRCLLLCAVCCVLLCVWSFLIRRGAVGGDTKGMRGHREKTRNITRENLCYLPANHVTGNYRYQVSHIPKDLLLPSNETTHILLCQGAGGHLVCVFWLITVFE